ncbi:hypothetical protein AA313_de0206120 [Arthrobotrys entomopaga]|nr:hypothetical protein AA313_de0206120 [Arthrobotrys entomopaga]
MDPIIAFGVAVNVLTIVDLAVKVIFALKDGGIQDGTEKLRYASDLQTLSRNLSSNKSSLGSSPEEKSLQDCAKNVIEISETLQKELNFQNGNSSKLKTFFYSLKNTVSTKIPNLEKQLERVERELNTRLLVTLRQQILKIDYDLIQQSDQYKTLDTSNQRLFTKFCQSNDSLMLLIRAESEETRTLVTDQFDSLKKAEEQKQITNRRKKIKQSLIKSNPFIRKVQITEMHVGTCSWILNIYPVDSGKKELYSTFPDWLHRGSGVFWIQGKPGAGKSTLMKYIHQSEKVQEELRSWAEPKELLCLEFFFWLADVAGMQNSLKGFLCYTLYQLLKEKWTLDESYLQDHHSFEKRGPENWDSAELKVLILDAVKKISVHKRIFFLIDGLDECAEADFQSVFAMVEELGLNTDIKFCVSSRPEHKINVRLEGKATAMLKVEDYTRQDIRKFVTERLQFYENLDGWLRLVDKVVYSSDGIFLWAILVSEDIRKGVENGDPVSQLYDRVKTLPKDITKLYKEMLDRIGPDFERYKSEAALYLSTFLDLKHGMWANFTLAARLGEFTSCYEKFQNIKSSSATIDEKKTLLDKLEARINTVTAGLLLVVPNPRYHGTPPPETSNNYQETWNREVTFVHRTAKDYMEEYGQDILGCCQFSKVKRLANIFDAYMGLSHSGFRYIFSPVDIDHYIYILSIIEGDIEEKVDFLVHLEESMSSDLFAINGQRNDYWVNDYWAEYDGRTTAASFRAFRYSNDPMPLDLNGIILTSRIVEHGLLEAKLARFQGLQATGIQYLSRDYKNWLLLYATERPNINKVWIRKLLENGADPNAIMYYNLRNKVKTTPWLNFLVRLIQIRLFPLGGQRLPLAQIAKVGLEDIINLFIDKAANLNDKAIILAHQNRSKKQSPSYIYVDQGLGYLKPCSNPRSFKKLSYIVEVNGRYLLESFCRRNADFACDSLLRRPELQLTEAYRRILFINWNVVIRYSLTYEDKNERYPTPVVHVTSADSERLLKNFEIQFLLPPEEPQAQKAADQAEEELKDLWDTADQANPFTYLESAGYYKEKPDPPVLQERLT